MQFSLSARGLNKHIYYYYYYYYYYKDLNGNGSDLHLFFQNYAVCVVGTRKLFLVFWLPSIKLPMICFYSKKPKMILK